MGLNDILRLYFLHWVMDRFLWGLNWW